MAGDGRQGRGTVNSVTFLQNTFVRQQPGVGSAILFMATKGATAELTQADPVRKDGLVWWPLVHPNGVSGWSARKTATATLFTVAMEQFEPAIAFTLSWEGGYVNDFFDAGGETNMGISKKSYPDLDIKNLTVEQAKAIYYEDYWLPSKAYLDDYPACVIRLDIAVLMGVARSLLFVGVEPIKIIAAQLTHITHFTQFERYGRGWVRRTADLLHLLEVGRS